ncbi:UDP-4-amino-4,6-dideoxy-N-acetyl-beta-L-altrosamine N-acetyltransferase [Aliarcobacter lanthieri]|uniref:UDP-4-amino-4, 6-dideoxy-N-acetyl-beta-L-altrosamine N-acetyltransferase n=1 Tax=Aliarcobacter lanthieri TaxID=1355374 RepID=UPI003AAC5C16
MKDIELVNFVDLSLDEKKMILEWRNNKSVREWMYTQDEISMEIHLEFMDSLKLSKDRVYFLVKKDSADIGVINFTNLFESDIYFGLYANPNTKMLGVGRVLEEISIDYAFNILKVKRLKLEVFEDNIKVRNLHKKYGFKESGEKIINSRKVICMEFKNEY